MPYNLMLFRGVGRERASPVVTVIPEQWNISVTDMCQSGRASWIGVSRNRKRLPFFYICNNRDTISRELNPEKFFNVNHEYKYLSVRLSTMS